MYINGIGKIDSDKGPYIVLADYGLEGLSVYSQHMSVSSAVKSFESNGPGTSLCLLKIVDVSVSENEEDDEESTSASKS